MRKSFFGLLLMVGPLMAEEGGGEPKLSPIWDVLNFVILAVLLGYLIVKNMGPMLVARSQQIQEGLAAGEKAKADADARAAAVQAKLADLGQVIEQMRASSKEEREREAERIRRETEAEFTRIKQHAEQEIGSAGKLARLEVQRFAARLAIGLAEQKVRARMSPQTQTDLLNNFIGEIAGSTSHLG
jgi:F-type H+-transporting ATPase subunit b